MNTQSAVNFAELFANIGLVGLQVGGVLPPGTSVLATAIEQAVAPLISSIANRQSTSQEVFAGFGAATAVLALLKGKTSDPQLIANIDAQMKAVSDGAAAFLAGETGTPDLATLAVPVPTV